MEKLVASVFSPVQPHDAECRTEARMIAARGLLLPCRMRGDRRPLPEVLRPWIVRANEAYRRNSEDEPESTKFRRFRSIRLQPSQAVCGCGWAGVRLEHGSIVEAAVTTQGCLIRATPPNPGKPMQPYHPNKKRNPHQLATSILKQSILKTPIRCHYPIMRCPPSHDLFHTDI